MNYPNNRSNPATNRTMLPGTVPLSQVSVVPLPRNNSDSSPLGLVTIYDPHQHEPGQPSALQKRRCRTIVALALIIWGLFITVYIFITSPDDPVRCNEYNICNNHYLMFFVGPILLFTGCSMACYNFMTYGGCCHSIKSCSPDDACGRTDTRGQTQDVSIFPNVIRNYMAAAAANNTVAVQMDGPPAYQCVVAEPWRFLGTTKALHNYEHSDQNYASHDLHFSKELKDYERPPPDNQAYNDADASTEDVEPPPYNAITPHGSYFARNSISTQTQLDLNVSALNDSASSSSLSKDNVIRAPMTVAEQQSHLSVERPKSFSQLRRKSNSISCLPSITRQNNESNVESHN